MVGTAIETLIRTKKHKKHNSSDLLFHLQPLKASLANANVELEAHDGNVDPINRALVTNRLATVTAMMLANADLFLINHRP